ncbi:RNA-binding S4 domain-containing protein [Jannaschia donghaensis]|uniref:Heat shock protein 15 n=1 Tax=Jannaschia donghaensis TaxID=420998 RepID=A0A0M6YIL2_9RHOB|nr:RNA-binding S4 domain-containing protein [Jannaschia donghaensis]CTQ50202.1 Heat shock protein 15 [Jannaschia donghaensis]
MSDASGKQRIDKWLWQARFFKTRTLAARVVAGGRVRLNEERVTKGSTTVSPGDILTFAQADHIRVVAIIGLPTRRGPAAEAQALYDDRSPAPVARVGPRPTGRDRRRMQSDLTELRGWSGSDPTSLE